MNSLFFRKPDGIYYEGKRLKGVDTASFRILLGNWATDGKKVFHAWTSRNDLDPETFEPLNNCFGKDRRCVVAKHLLVKAADPVTFRVLDSGLTTKRLPGPHPWDRCGYGIDGSSVFWANIRLPRGNPSTFLSLRSGFGLDDRDVYFNDRQISSGWPKTALNVPALPV